MTTGLVKKTVDVVLGEPQAVADRIEVVFAEQGVAAVCKRKGSLVRADISLLEERPEDSLEVSIEQAATDVAARVRWSDDAAFAAAPDHPSGRGVIDDAKHALQDGAARAIDAIHDATDRDDRPEERRGG
jgi:hypothetical protein